MIDYIETNTYSLGILGRSGSRSIVNYITRYYFDYAWEQHRNIQLGVELVDPKFPSHHPYSWISVDDFNGCNALCNDINPRIMVIRDPLERAESGSSVSYEPVFHGAPILTDIDWSEIDYVIPFEDLVLYIGKTMWSNLDYIWSDIDESRENRHAKETGTASLYQMMGIEPYKNIIQEWKVSDYDYQKEIECYNKVLTTKKQLPPELWKSMVRDTMWCNIPSKHLKQMN